MTIVSDELRDAGTNDKIIVKLAVGNCQTRWPCVVCSGQTEEVSVHALGKAGDVTICVCESCLDGCNIDGGLKQHAEGLRVKADFLEGLIGRLEVPTYTEWQEACYRADS